MFVRASGVVLFAQWLLQVSAYATGVIPPCNGGGHVLPIDNQQVLHWKVATPNQFLQRAHVQGAVTRIFPDRNGHVHYEIKIGLMPTDTLEVVYNASFGACPRPLVGMKAEACGDYITSIAQSGQFPPSPSGAIIHWIHKSDNEVKHDSGFVVLGGQICGRKLGSGPER